MAEDNGNEARAALARLQKRLDEHDESFAQLRLIVTNLSDAMVVQSVLERKQSEAIVEGESRQDRLDARVDKLVSSIGELIRRIPPENLKP
jgi:hypothetical protein